MQAPPYIITISSEKGGVGKTTLATNLAIYLKAVREDLPVTIFSFDNHFTVDRMFEINPGQRGATVYELLMGQRAADLVQLGQYGVGYIPSSTELDDLHERFRDPKALAPMFANSELTGIVIIDTRPDLNSLTRNALYAADRVLIPVKDMPSVENCKNIFALFDNFGFDKGSLSLIPCLIDERIKFQGEVRDQKTLLRAFAAKRGYRCLGISISKSPKVESLGTNPDGKIYPILTHARETEVYKQYLQVTREILGEFDDARSFLGVQLPREDDQSGTYLGRVKSLINSCPICGVPLLERQENRGLYFETATGKRGFLHNDCFTDMLCGALYGLYDHSQALGAARTTIAEKAGNTVSLFNVRDEGNTQVLEFKQLNPTGGVALSKQVRLTSMGEGEFDGLHDRLHVLLSQSLGGSSKRFQKGVWLAVHPVDSANPEAILLEESYGKVQKLHAKLADILKDAGNHEGTK